MRRCLCVLVLPLLLPALLAQKPARGAAAPAADPRAAATWFPLQPGHRLVWQVDVNDWDESYSTQYESIVWGDVPLEDGTVCTQILDAPSLGAGCTYWRADAKGLWQLAGAALDSRGVGREATRRIPGPIGSITTWHWEETLPGPGGTATGGTKVQHVGTLVSMAEPVTVPAGTYSTLHVRFESTGANRPVLDQWFAAGVGLVKSVQAGGPPFHSRVTRTLLRCEPGVALDHDAVLREALTVERDAPRAWLRLGPAAFHLRGRLAIVRHRPDVVSCWLVTRHAWRIGVDDLVGWQAVLTALVGDEPRFMVAGGPGTRELRIGGEPPLLALADLVGRVESERRQLKIVRTTDHRMETREKDGKLLTVATHTVVAATDAGHEHEVRVGLDLLAGQMARVTVTCAQPAPAEPPFPPRKVAR